MNKDDFFKTKTSEELTSFLKSIQKTGIEKMPEGELDAHLDYNKNEQSSNPSLCKNYTSKKVKTYLAENIIQVTKDRVTNDIVA